MAKGRASSSRVAAPSSPFASFSPLVRDLFCVGLLYAITLFIFRGIVFNNAAFAASGDTAAALSYAHAGDMIKQAEHVDVLWMPYFFSGMPTFGNVAYIPHDISYLQTSITKVINLLFLNGTWTWMVVFYFVAGVFMFMLARTWKFDRIPALFAAITFMLSPYAIGLAAEGHGSKLMALSYLPLIVLLTHLLFERRNLLSFGLLAAGVGTLLLTNHMQMVYYVLIVAGLYLLYTIILDWRERKNVIPAQVLLLLGALVVGVCISSYIYLSVYEYAQFSIRGGGTAGAAGGLAYDYATNWSWSLWDAITLLIPGFYGLGGGTQNFYWGHMEPWTDAYVYVGLLPILFAIVALTYRRTVLAWFMAICTVLFVLVSLGRNFPVLYDVMFAVLPFFNKFRAPSQILHLLPFTLGILGAIGYTAVEGLSGKRGENERFARTMAIVSAIAGGLFLLGLLFKSPLHDFFTSFLFLKDTELPQLREQYGAQWQQAVQFFKEQRFNVFWTDYLKFLALLCATAGAMYFFVRQKITATVFAGSILLLAFIDLAVIDSRLITPQPRQAAEDSFRPSATVTFLKQQPGLFRVFPLGNLFMDNTFAYHGIQSIGGYSPAKLKIYQTMLDSCMYSSPNPQFPINMAVVNMLNTEYLVAQGRLPDDRFQLVNVDQAQRTLTYKNPAALPRAWFVENVVTARTDHEVFGVLNGAAFDPAKTAVIQAPVHPPQVERPDSASARVTGFQSRRITISATTPKPALLVVSEVYYPAGWKAFVDGQETEIYRTNSVLRSVVVPQGTHEVVMAFDPLMYHAGYVISNAAWGLAALCILIGLWMEPRVRAWVSRRHDKVTTQAA